MNIHQSDMDNLKGQKSYLGKMHLVCTLCRLADVASTTMERQGL